MSNLGDRLKDERMRLGLSQAAFAERLGVHRNTQIKYESGERVPDSDYLDNAQKIGVDIYYLYSGIVEKDRESYQIAVYELAKGIYSALGFDRSQIKAAELALVKLIDADLENGGALEPDEEWGRVTLPRFVAEFLQSSPLLASVRHVGEGLSVELLTAILEGVDSAVIKLQGEISTVKRAQAIAMLYRAFKASGRVDPAVIDEAVKLAAD